MYLAVYLGKILGENHWYKLCKLFTEIMFRSSFKNNICWRCDVLKTCKFFNSKLGLHLEGIKTCKREVLINRWHIYKLCQMTGQCMEWPSQCSHRPKPARNGNVQYLCASPRLVSKPWVSCLLRCCYNTCSSRIVVLVPAKYDLLLKVTSPFLVEKI